MSSDNTEAQQDAPAQPQREPTIIFLFDMKNWYETISPLSKLDLFDVAPNVSTQFYMDYGIKAYVLILTKSKWDILPEDLKKKFMIISRRIKEEMEGPMPSLARERYESTDIFKLLMGDTSETPQETQQEDAPQDGEPQIKEYVIPPSSSSDA